MCASALSRSGEESNIAGVSSQRKSERRGLREIDLLSGWLLSTDWRENWHF
jgi:hypothetical protein